MLAGFATLTLATSGIVAPRAGAAVTLLADTVAGRAHPQARALARVPDPASALTAADGLHEDTAVVSRRIETVDEEIPFPVQRIADRSLYVGQTVVAQAGVPGVKRTRWLVRSAGPNVEDQRPSSILEVAAPVPQIIRVGALPVPAPAPIAAPAVSYGSGAIQDIIIAAAGRWGADAQQLLRVAKCESGFNPNAYNASSGASGLFQFLPSTWAANSVRAGYGGASSFDPVANANTAAMMFRNGQAGQWVCK